MKSTEMEIYVQRRPDGTPEFSFPADWDFQRIIDEISELCCTLAEELEEEKIKNYMYKCLLDYDKNVRHLYES